MCVYDAFAWADCDLFRLFYRRNHCENIREKNHGDGGSIEIQHSIKFQSPVCLVQGENRKQKIWMNSRFISFLSFFIDLPNFALSLRLKNYSVHILVALLHGSMIQTYSQHCNVLPFFTHFVGVLHGPERGFMACGLTFCWG